MMATPPLHQHGALQQLGMLGQDVDDLVGIGHVRVDRPSLEKLASRRTRSVAGSSQLAHQLGSSSRLGRWALSR